MRPRWRTQAHETWSCFFKLCQLRYRSRGTTSVLFTSRGFHIIKVEHYLVSSFGFICIHNAKISNKCPSEDYYPALPSWTLDNFSFINLYWRFEDSCGLKNLFLINKSVQTFALLHTLNNVAMTQLRGKKLKQAQCNNLKTVRCHTDVKEKRWFELQWKGC